MIGGWYNGRPYEGTDHGEENSSGRYPGVEPDRSAHRRPLFGGAPYHGWTAAILAAKTLDGFEERFTRVHAAAEYRLAHLAEKPGISVERVVEGSNIVFFWLDESVATGLRERLTKHDIAIRKVHDGRLQLVFNEAILRKPVVSTAAAI